MFRYKKNIRFFFKLILSIICLITVFLVSMNLGAANISIEDVWKGILTNSQEEKILIIREIRLPRSIVAMLVGVALGIAGAIMQGITRNSLADPGLLGLTAGANLVLAITLVLLPNSNYFLTMIICFFGAALGALFTFGISFIKRGEANSFKIVLAGAAVSFLFNALSEGIGIYFRISKEISMWSSGGLIGANWKQIKIILPAILFGIVISLIFSKELTVLSLNKEVAIGLGQNIKKVQAILFIIIVILTGASVSIAGNIAFIGLMVPHIARVFVGGDYRYILPMTIFLGASIMLLSDTLARTISAPYEIPVIAVISILGLPFFLFIAHKGRKI